MIRGLSSRIRARPSFYLNAFRLLKNAPTFLLDWFGLYPESQFQIEMRNGAKFIIRTREDEFVFNEIVFHKIYLPPGFEFKDGATVVDVGAHIGIFTVLASSSAKNVKVFAYEPFPENFKLLQQNVLGNNLTHTKVFPYAVTDSGGERTLYTGITDFGSQSLYHMNDQFIQVRCTTLRDVFDENRISRCDLLKIDAEGAEYEILFNTPPEYLDRVRNIVLECHRGIGEFSPAQLERFLQDAGFETSWRTAYPFDILSAVRS